jgi:hypothetical protein
MEGATFSFFKICRFLRMIKPVWIIFVSSLKTGWFDFNFKKIDLKKQKLKKQVIN